MDLLKRTAENMKSETLKRKVFVLILPMIFAGGCAVGPNYQTPQTPMPDQWQQDLQMRYGLNTGEVPSEYWRIFNDPILNDLIERAKKNNYDLKIAWWNLEQANAQIGVIKGEFYPKVDADGSYTRARSSKYGLSAPAPLTDAKTGRVTYPDPQTYELNSFGGTALWEIDIFGRIRRSYESVIASQQASLENYHDVMVSLYANMAVTYIEARTIQKRLKIAAANIELQKKTLALAMARYESGLVPALDVAQAKANLAATEASVPEFQSELQVRLNKIDILLGEQPGTAAKALIKEGSIPKVPVDIAMGLPADLIRRRPDIRQAERLLAAQTAQIGVATSELYPFFSLTGSLHFEAMDFDDLGRAYSGAYSFGPQMTWNIFDGNRIRSRIKVQEAATEQALVTYQRTVLVALQEIQDAANNYVYEIDRREKLGDSVKALEESVRLVETQYRNGLTDFQNVLDMQRSLFVQQDNLAISEGLSIGYLIRVFRSAGCGWEKSDGSMCATSQPACSTRPVETAGK
jgi:NodT family efflux transporter outer membrane factor (OMF) lipoprotein